MSSFDGVDLNADTETIFDLSGRQIAERMIAYSPDEQDIIKSTSYDVLGRVTSQNDPVAGQNVTNVYENFLLVG